MEFLPSMAILHIMDGQERTEVRGHPAIGTVYEGSRLDRVLDGLGAARFNLSTLYAEQVLHVKSARGEPVRELLRIEDHYADTFRMPNWHSRR
jgi:hypothetical protein